MPAVTPVQVNAYGAVASSPSFVEPLKNSTLAMVPSASEAVAARSTVAGAEKLAPFAGCVSATAGGESSWTLTMRATDGTPLRVDDEEHVRPGRRDVGVRGAVAVRLVAPAVNASGT